MKKWLEKYWPVLLITSLLLAAFFIGRHHKASQLYKREIKAQDAFIEKLMSEYQTLEDSASVVKKQVEVYENQVLSYQDSLSDTKTEIINLKQRHAKQVADLIRIPSDVLYIDYTRWIDTISFE
jgi:predicted  nucleic acid-binding Zn-ribbon protein